MASPGNRHCASCIGTLSLPIGLSVVDDCAWCDCVKEVIRVVRDFKCCASTRGCCACCRCCQMEVQVEAPVGQIIGYIRQQ